MRESTTEALGRIGEPAVKPLIRELNDADRGVRSNAAESARQDR